MEPMFDATIYTGNDIIGLQRDADAGDARAQYLFAKHILREPDNNEYRKELSEEEIQRGLRYMQLSAAQGYMQGVAAEELGAVYLDGEIVPVDYEKAKMWFNAALLKGMPIAAYQLGNCAYYGYGEDVDYKKAADLYLKAARGYDNAICCLANMYLKGEYLPYDPVFAKIIYVYAMQREEDFYSSCGMHSDIYDIVCKWLDNYKQNPPPIPEKIIETEEQAEVRKRLVKIMDKKMNKPDSQTTEQKEE